MQTLGFKHYELTNHLGNVLSVVTDNINLSPDSAFAKIVAATDYYAFGSEMPGRTYSSPLGGGQEGAYRYGFNGKEKDTENTWGDTSYDYGFRIYNPRYGRFLSVDPIAQSYPWYTPYQFAGNKPIWAIDLDGLEEAYVLRSQWYEQGIKTAISKGDYTEAYRLARKSIDDPAKNEYAKKQYKGNFAGRWVYNGYYPTGISIIGTNGDMLFTLPIEPFLDKTSPEYEVNLRIGVGISQSIKQSLFGIGAGKEFSITKTLFEWNYKNFSQTSESQTETFDADSPWELQIGIHKQAFGANFSTEFDDHGVISREYNFKAGPINSTFDGITGQGKDNISILDISSGSGLLKFDLSIESNFIRFVPYMDKTKNAPDALRYEIKPKISVNQNNRNK